MSRAGGRTGVGANSAPSAAKARAPKSKKPADADPNADGDKDPPIKWSKRPELTWKFVSWLKEFPNERTKLFSDSSADAKGDQRKKLVAKESKTAQFERIAQYLFADDPREAEGFARNGSRYGRSTQQHLQRIKTAYREHCQALGQTGAGVRPEDVVPGSPLHNAIDVIKQTFPWWDDLHAYWKELPTYNPCSISTSIPGADHAAAAAALYEDSPRDSDNEDADADADDEDETAGSGSRDSSASTRAESLAPEAREEMEADLLANEDGSEGSVVLADGSKLSTASSASSVVPVKDVVARKGEPQGSAPARSVPPDLPPRKGETKPPAAPSPSSGSALKQKISGLTKPSVKGRKNILDGFNETRLAENSRLSKKRELEHTEFMAKLSGERSTKRLKIESEERRLREDREFKLAEAERQRAHALQMKQLDLQIAIAAAGSQRAGPSRTRDEQMLPSPRHGADAFGFGSDALDLDNPAFSYI